MWRELRERCPLPHTDRYGGAWAAIRYEDVCAIAHDPDVFSSRHTSVLDRYPEPSRSIQYPPLNLDPPMHSGFRRILLPQFGPPAVAALRPHTERICEDLLDRLADRTEVDGAVDYVRHIVMHPILTDSYM